MKKKMPLYATMRGEAESATTQKTLVLGILNANDDTETCSYISSLNSPPTQVCYYNLTCPAGKSTSPVTQEIKSSATVYALATNTYFPGGTSAGIETSFSRL